MGQRLNLFKNILCYCSTKKLFPVPVAPANLKTSYVIVQPALVQIFRYFLKYLKTSYVIVQQK